MFVGDAVRLDPIRAVEAVTAGVAFLAAGTILFARGEVHGLTTGAGMWLAGAIGLAAGLGLWQIAAVGTVLALIVLGLLQTLEARFDLSKRPDFNDLAGGDKDARRSVEPKPDDPSHVQPSDR
jgi:putative Mg2+ transporter-C (MgtC) family protein